MDQLTVSLVQSILHWENPEANRNLLENHIQRITKTDLIILPEMFSSAFTMNAAKSAELMDGDSVRWMQQMAKEKEAVVCGSLIIEESGNYYNRFLWVDPHGGIQTYDKRHLFSMADEHLHYMAGTKRIICDLKGWKICPLVCYDLRFPVWSRNRFENDHWDYDMLIYVANWPSPRAAAWEKLLYARAIENQSFAIGVNRVGEDEKGLTYIGGSMLVNEKGELLAKAKEKSEEVITHTIDPSKMIAFRKKFPLGRDADRFEIRY